MNFVLGPEDIGLLHLVVTNNIHSILTEKGKDSAKQTSKNNLAYGSLKKSSFLNGNAIKKKKTFENFVAI